MATSPTGLTGPAAAAVSALKSGSDPIAAGLAESDSTTTDPSNPNRDADDDASVDETANDDLHDPDSLDSTDAEDADGGDDDADEEGDDSEEGEAPADVEEVTVTDEKGKRKIRIDYSDRDATKKAHLEAAGMRKFQRERDSERAAHAATRKKYEGADEKLSHFDKLDAAWQEKGMEGLVHVLTGGKQTWDQAVDAVLAQRQKIAMMSPAEQETYKKLQEAEAGKRAAEKVQQDYQKKLAEIDSRTERAEKAQLQGHMDGAFTANRFAGKLGNPATEHRIDSMLWNGVRSELMKLPDDVEITQQMIDKEFRVQASALRSVIKEQARRETTKTLKQKKTEAKTNAQSQMKSGSRPSTEEAEMRRDIRAGDTQSAVRRWLMGNKKK